VLGVDVDERMAGYARRDGFEVETARFETWDAAGRSFDLVISGQAWHWVDPVVGARRAADVLRPGGRLAVFWNVFLPPPDVADAFADVHRRVLADSPRNPWANPTLDGYAHLFDRVAQGIAQADALADTRQYQFDWERSYTRDEWLDQLATSGETGRLSPARRSELLSATAAAIDRLGGHFRMRYAAIAMVAARRSASD
jgi:SAM-dependent methyltransferase